MIFTRVFSSGINLVSKRFIRKKINLKSWPNDWVPFVWKRPEETPGYFESGDLVDLGQASPEDLLPDVRKSLELRKLDPDDPLRKIFSLNHGKVSNLTKALVTDQYKRLGLIHEIDYINSREARIVNLTYALRHVQGKIRADGENHRYQSHTRCRANDIKNLRYRYLCELKEMHVDRYEQLIKTLQIEPKNNLINVPYEPPHRKRQMRLLAIQYARDIKEKKVDEFIASLEQEKLEFEKEKEETLRWIQEQENKLGITI